MDLENVVVEIKGGVAHVTMNRPKVLNALNAATLEELRSVLLDIRKNDSVGAVILTGAGEKAFVAGADISELNRLSPAEAKRYGERGQSVLLLLERLGKPVIGAINGFALGGGCELAMACTIRYASDNARFGQPEVNLGLIPGFAGTQRLSRLVGKGRAMDICLTGRMVDADEALRIGLVNRVTSKDELLPECEKVAQTILSKGPVAVSHCMEAIHHGMEMGFVEGCRHEASLFGLVCASDDMKEGTAAFLEKRKPSFNGR